MMVNGFLIMFMFIPIFDDFLMIFDF